MAYSFVCGVNQKNENTYQHNGTILYGKLKHHYLCYVLSANGTVVDIKKSKFQIIQKKECNFSRKMFTVEKNKNFLEITKYKYNEK